MTEESNTKRVNISIDAKLHADVKVILAAQETNLSAEVSKHLASLVQEHGDQPLTGMQKYNARLKLPKEERIEQDLEKARIRAKEWKDARWDEERARSLITAQVTEEITKQENT